MTCPARTRSDEPTPARLARSSPRATTEFVLRLCPSSRCRLAELPAVVVTHGFPGHAGPQRRTFSERHQLPREGSGVSQALVAVLQAALEKGLTA